MKKSYIKLIKFSAILFVVGFIFFGSTNSAHAATKTWDGSTSGSWSVGTNWSGDIVPVTGDDLVFPNGASNLSNTNDLTENTIFNSITFSGSGYTLSGNRIILGQGLAGITDSVSSGGNEIALDIRVDTTRDIVVSNLGETLTISGRISGVGGLTKEGVGKLVLSGANTFGGILKINVGVVNAQNDRALGTILAGTEVVGNAALEFQNGINITYEALALRGYGVNSNGALRNISGNNTFGGLITMIAGGAEIQSDSGTLNLNGGMAGAFPLVIDGAGNVTYSKTPIGIAAGTVTKNGAGILTYNFPNTYTGLTTINAGTLLYGVNNALLSGAITVTGGTLDIATFSDMVGTVTLGTLNLESGTITGTTGMLSGAAWTVYNGTISAIIAGDMSALTKSTPGTVVLTRANQYTGATTVSLGILEIQDSLSLGDIDGITTVTAGATLQVNGTGLSVPEYITFAGTGHLYTGAIRNKTGNNTLTGLLTMSAAGRIVSDTGTTLSIDSKGLFAGTSGLTIGGLGNTTFTAPIYGTSATLSKQDAGTLRLQAFNNFTGATNINRGEVILSDSGAMPLSTAVTISPGGTLTLDNTDSNVVVDRLADTLAFTMNGGNFNFIGSDSIDVDETAGVLTSGVATQSGNNVITISPGSGGSTTMQFASLTRTAGSSLLFRGTSLGADPGPGVSTLLFKLAPTLTGSGGLQNTTTISIIQGAFGDNSLSGTGTDMVTYGLGNSNGLRLLNGAGFSGEYAFTLATNANVKLSTSTVAATSSINSLILSGSANITDAGTSQTITLASGNILNLVSNNTIAGANTTIAGGAVEIKVSTQENLDISSLITTTTGLTKSGAGTLTFSTSKTYTGLTSVNGGTLLAGVNNFISSGNITINNGTLDIASFSDTVGAVILQTGTITGSSGVLSGTSYSFREGTVSAIINGVGVALTRIATNTAPDSVVILTRDNTYTGNTTITSGILKLGTAGGGTNTPLGTVSAGVIIASGGALDLNGYTLGTSEPITSLQGTGFGPAGSSNMGAIMNSSALPVTYSGTLTLTAAARINADAGALTISSAINGNFALTVGGFSDIMYSGVRSGTSTIVKDGIGVLTLSGNSSYSGATTISVGTVKLGATGSGANTPLGTTAGITTVSLGARLDLNGFTLATNEPLTLNGVGYGLGDFASGALMNSSGSAVTYGGLITLGTAGPQIRVDYGDINLTAAGTISGATFALTIGGSGNGTLASILGTTTGTLTKIGTGTWTLSGQSTFTGATSINRGILKLGASGGATNTPLGTTGAGTSVLSGAVLDFNGFNVGTAEALTINGRGIDDGGALIGANVTFAGAVAQATDSRITNSSGTFTVSGAVSGAFALYAGGAGNTTFGIAIPTAGLLLTKQGAGTLTVTGTNLNTGTIRIDAGTLTYGAATTLAAAPIIVTGGTFNMNATTDTVGAITLVGGTISNGTLTGTAYTIESGTVSAVLAGAIAFVKNTNNTVTLTGANTMSSTTTINAGTLALSGSGSAVSTTITVNLGGTLTLDNSTTAVASRLGDALALTLNGGNFNFIGNSAGVSSETAGALTLPTGHNTVTITPGTGGSTTMTFASLSRTAGATALFRGTNMRSAAGANVSTLIFTAAPTLTGAAGAEGTTTMSVLKGAFGDTSLSGTGSDMVTVISNKLSPLASGEYTGDLQTANANVKLTADRAAVATNTNSLILNGFGITNPGGAITIPISSASLSGNILINSATNIAGANTTLGITTTELPILATADSTISAVIGTATTGSVTLSGTGNVTMSATNLYTSTTFINGANLFYGASNVISSGGVTMRGGSYNLDGNSDTIGSLSLTASTVTTGAGTLTGNGSFTTATNANYASTISGNLGLGANATFTIGDGLMDNDAVISAVISGAFTFAKAGTGVLVLSGSNSYSGATTVSGGTLRLGATGGGTNTPLGTTAGGTTVSGASSVLDLNGYTLGTTEALTLSGALAAGALQNNSSANVDYSGQVVLGAASTIISNYGDINITATGNITGNTFALTIGGAGNGILASNLNTSTGTLTKNGIGVWTISGGASTFTGATTISAGTLKLGSAGSGSNTPFGTSAGGISITSGAIFDLNGFTLATAEALAINGTGIASIGAFINSSNNSISYSGVITPGATSRLANYGSGLLTLTGNIVGSTRAITFVTVGNITQSSSSVWSGTSTSLIKEGSGTLILAGQNSFTTGTVTVSTGVLQLGASGGATNTPLGTSGAGTTVSAGAMLDFSTYALGGASTYETLNISGSGIKNGGALLFSGSGNNNFGAMTIAANTRVINNGAGIVAFRGLITAANSINFGIGGSGPVSIIGVYGATATSATITKRDAGTTTISAVSITTGLVRINGGTFKYGIADALATPAVTVAGGTWDLGGFSEGGTTLIGAVTLIDGSIVNTGGAATITSSAAYTVEKGTISAVLAGAAITMNKNTAGTVTLSAANTFAGLTSINAGTLAWGINDALSSGALTVTGGVADLGTRTDTVGTVTMVSGAINSSSGVLTGTSYAMQSGTVGGILGGSIALAKTTAGTLIMTNSNTYTGTTTITAGTIRATSSAALGNEGAGNTLIFNGGTLQAGGNISSPSGRTVTLTSSGLIDTNGYTIDFAGTVGSASGFTKYGLGTLTTSGAVTLGNAMSVTHGTYNQAGSLNMTSGAVTIASAGAWSNVGTGAVTLAGAVTNSGRITLNSNNGSQCVDGVNSILVRSSVNNTLRAWSGNGTFTMYNLDVDDMTGSIVTAYNSTLSGDTTWTVGTCGIIVSGTSNGSGTVKFAVDGVLSAQSAVIGGGIWSASSVEVLSTGQVVTAWIDGVADSSESTALAKWDGAGSMTGLVLNTGALSIGSVDNQSLSLTNLDVYDCSADEDIMHSVIANVLNVEGQSCAGSVNNSYTDETLSTLASNTLSVATTETITTEKIINTGTVLVSGSPTFNLAGTSGTLLTNPGTFLGDTSVVNLTGNGNATINSGSPTLYDLTISGTGVKSLGAGLTLDNLGELAVSAGTFNPATFLVTGDSSTLTVAGGATLNVDAGTFAGNYSSGFTTITLNANSIVDYVGTTQAVKPIAYSNLNINSSGVSTITADVDVLDTLNVNGGIASIAEGQGADVNLSVGNLTIGASGTLNANSYNIKVGGNYSNSGTFDAGTGAVLFEASDVGNTLTGTMTGTSKFNNIVFNNADGAWSFGANPALVGGNFSIGAGAVTAPSTTLTVGGDFVNTPGTNTSFVHNSGLVVLNTTGTSKVIGDTTFDNFTVATGNKKVEFNSGDTFTINGLLTLTGTDTTPIYIDSTEGNNTQWFIDHQGTESIAYVDLNNSGCDAGSTNVSMGYSSKDGSNNDKDCWIFPVINRGGGGGDAGGEVSAPPGDPEGGGGQGGGGGEGGGEGGGGGGEPEGGGGSGGGGGDTGFLFDKVRFLASALHAFKTLFFF